MDVCSTSVPESGQCQACHRIFLTEGTLTKHLRKHCNAANANSKRLWKNGTTNMKRLNSPHTNPRKRVHEEAHNDDRVQGKQPLVNIHDRFDMVRILLLLYSGLDDTHLSSRMLSLAMLGQ